MSKKCPVEICPKCLKIRGINGKVDMKLTRSDCCECHGGTGYSPENKDLKNLCEASQDGRLKEMIKECRPETLEGKLSKIILNGIVMNTPDNFPAYYIEAATKEIFQAIRTWLLSKIPQKLDILDHHEKYHSDCLRCKEILAINQTVADIKRNMGV